MPRPGTKVGSPTFMNSGSWQAKVTVPFARFAVTPAANRLDAVAQSFAVVNSGAPVAYASVYVWFQS